MWKMSLSCLFIEFSFTPLTLYSIIQVFIHYCHFFLIHSIFRIHIIRNAVCGHHRLSKLHTLQFPLWNFALLIYLSLSFLHLISFLHTTTFFQFKRLRKLIHFLLCSFRFSLAFCIKNLSFLNKYCLTYSLMFFKWFR